MKKIFIIVFVLLLAFTFIRIATSTYENIKRGEVSQIGEFEIG